MHTRLLRLFFSQFLLSAPLPSPSSESCSRLSTRSQRRPIDPSGRACDCQLAPLDLTTIPPIIAPDLRHQSLAWTRVPLPHWMNLRVAPNPELLTAATLHWREHLEMWAATPHQVWRAALSADASCARGRKSPRTTAPARRSRTACAQAGDRDRAPSPTVRGRHRRWTRTDRQYSTATNQTAFPARSNAASWWWTAETRLCCWAFPVHPGTCASGCVS
jgi:hypothetical protein